MKWTPRIALSCLLMIGIALSACASDYNLTSDDVTEQTKAITLPSPCGLWIAATPEAADARWKAAPTNPDMVQLALPNGLACVDLIVATATIEANWHGGGHAVVHYVHAPGVVNSDEPDLAHTSIEIYVDGVGWTHWDNGIGTSPSGPQDGTMAKTDMPPEDDIYVKCNYWISYVCELPNGLPALCRYCGCYQICVRDPYTGREDCDNQGCW